MQRSLKRAAVPPEIWLLAAITLSAALLRFWTLGSQSFWLDEATSIHELRLPLGGLLHAVRVHETTPPLYFVAAWVWSHIFGTGEVGVRSLSALAGTALVPVAYAAGRELVSRAAGLVCALLVALSPWMLWYSQEARSYMLFALFCGLSLWLWRRAERTAARRDLGLWAVASALAVLTHFFAGFLVAPEGLWLLYRLRSRSALAACVVVAAVQLAMLPLAAGDTGYLLNWLTALPLHTRITQIPVQFAVSQLYTGNSAPIRDGLWLGLLFLVLAGVLAVTGVSLRERGGVARAAVLAGWVVLIPVVMALLGSDYVVPRNMIGAWLPLAVIVGAVVSAPRLRIVGGIALVAMLVGMILADITQQSSSAYRRPDWRSVARVLGPARSDRMILDSYGATGEEPLAVYLPGTDFSYSGQPDPKRGGVIGELDVVAQPYETVVRKLPPGVRLTYDRQVGAFQVVRFALAPPRKMTETRAASLGSALVGPAPSGETATLFQPSVG